MIYGPVKAQMAVLTKQKQYQRVLDLQRSKRKLEEVLLAPRKGGEQRDEGVNSLEVCDTKA